MCVCEMGEVIQRPRCNCLEWQIENLRIISSKRWNFLLLVTLHVLLRLLVDGKEIMKEAKISQCWKFCTYLSLFTVQTTAYQLQKGKRKAKEKCGYKDWILSSFCSTRKKYYNHMADKSNEMWFTNNIASLKHLIYSNTRVSSSAALQATCFVSPSW